MSEDRNFVARWSRLKRDAEKADREAPGGAGTDAQEVPGTAKGLSPGQGPNPAKPEEAFDISSLPPIESISAGTDIRDFLRAGVPGELTKAALRRAWSADPAIRDFIGIAENQWDFTDPTAIPGFGPLQAADNVHDLVAQAMGKLNDGSAAPPDGVVSVSDSGSPPSPEATARADVKPDSHSHPVGPSEAYHHVDGALKPVASVETTETVALQHEGCAAELKRRPHGGALPKPE